MGMTPLELAQFTPYDLNLKYNGFIKKQDTEEMYFRKVGRLILMPHVKDSKEIELNKIWPTHYDKSASDLKATFTKTRMQEMLEAYNKSKEVN